MAVVMWQLRGALEQMRTKRIGAMVIECYKLKIDPSLPWSLLQMALWEKNVFGFIKG